MKAWIKKHIGNTRLFHFLSERRRKAVKALKNRRLRKYFRAYRTSESGKLKVGFVVQLYPLFDKQQALYEYIREREDCEAFLFVVPEDRWTDFSVPNDYTDNRFLAHYPEAIRVHKEDGSLISLEDYRLDYLFYPRPYDEHLPENIRSSHMMKSVKCCYIPYGVALSKAFDGANTHNHFFCNMYFFFMENLYMKERMIRETPYNYKHGLQRIEAVGYPPFDYFLGMQGEPANAVTWAPRWSLDPDTGRSHFFDYKDFFLKIAKDQERPYVFRPHPLLFQEVVKQQLMSQEELDAYLSALTEEGVVIDIKSSLHEALENTAILIVDFSSIIAEFFMTGRPIIYCESGFERNQTMNEMLKLEYVAHSEEELTKLYSMLLSGEDPKFEARKKYIKETYGDGSNSAAAIFNVLMEDAGRKVCI